MPNPVDIGYAVRLIKFNMCHDPADGTFCSGGESGKGAGGSYSLMPSRSESSSSSSTSYPQDLRTMSKPQAKEYIKEVIRTKTFRQLRDEQDMQDQQIQSAHEQLQRSKDPGEKARLERGIRNANFHRDMLTRAVDVMTFDDKSNIKLYEEATGQKWEDRPKTKQPGSGPFGR